MDELIQERQSAKANVMKALAHPTRLWMVESLAAGERCVCEFVAMAGVDFSTVSRHLAVLKQAGIVADRRQGKQIYYRLLAPCLLDFIHCIERVALPNEPAWSTLENRLARGVDAVAAESLTVVSITEKKARHGRRVGELHELA